MLLVVLLAVAVASLYPQAVTLEGTCKAQAIVEMILMGEDVAAMVVVVHIAYLSPHAPEFLMHLLVCLPEA
jgi:hypothetical protein